MEHCLSSRCETHTRPSTGRSLKLFAATFAAAAIVSIAQPAEAAVTAVLNGTTLEVTGDGANDIITLRLEPGNPANLQVFDGAVLVNTFAVAGITVIDVDGGAGTDTILRRRGQRRDRGRRGRGGLPARRR